MPSTSPLIEPPDEGTWIEGRLPLSEIQDGVCALIDFTLPRQDPSLVDTLTLNIIANLFEGAFSAWFNNSIDFDRVLQWFVREYGARPHSSEDYAYAIQRAVNPEWVSQLCANASQMGEAFDLRCIYNKLQSEFIFYIAVEMYSDKGTSWTI